MWVGSNRFVIYKYFLEHILLLFRATVIAGFRVRSMYVSKVIICSNNCEMSKERFQEIKYYVLRRDLCNVRSSRRCRIIFHYLSSYSL